jgi:hypothetical protein
VEWLKGEVLSSNPSDTKRKKERKFGKTCKVRKKRLFTNSEFPTEQITDVFEFTLKRHLAVVLIYSNQI